MKMLIVFLCLLSMLAGADVRTIRPFEIFDIEKHLPAEYKGRTVTHAFKVTRDTIWFLISPRDFEAQGLLRIDKSTGTSRFFPFHEHRRFLVSWLHADDAGNVVLVRQERENDTLTMFDGDGQVQRRVTVPGRASGFAILPEGLVSATWEGRLRLHASDGTIVRKFDTPVQGGIHLLPLPDRRVIGYDRVSGEGYRVDSHASITALRMTSEDIDVRLARKDPHGIVLPDVAGDAKGSLWTTLSPIRTSEGGIVVNLAPDGSHLQTFRCELPPTERTIDPNGLMVPFLIGVDDMSFYLASHSGIVARYLLDIDK